ncbi:hypothetical protein AB0H00_15245 [Nocardia sp. NPDC023852]|uniref:hypothetical protein n=1 Tax=Nocardia sp. NPDC023852 TaxID=3154697 RepID=UPI0033F56ECD
MSSLSRPLRGNRLLGRLVFVGVEGVTSAVGDMGGAGGAGNGAAIDECGAGP